LHVQTMEEALKELERCVKNLGMKGILLYSNNAGVFPDEAAIQPVFGAAQALDVPILLHPSFPVTFEQTKGYEMAAGLGLMFDTSIALTRIILAGILDQYPKLKLLCPHVGGTLPYIVGRIDHQTQVLKRGAEHIRKPPSEYSRNVQPDSVSRRASPIRCGSDFAGPARLLYASDHPWVDPKMIAANGTGLKLPAADEAKIFRSNAVRLFGL